MCLNTKVAVTSYVENETLAAYGMKMLLLYPLSALNYNLSPVFSGCLADALVRRLL